MVLNIALFLISAFGLLSLIQWFAYPRMSLDDARMSLEQICREASDPARSFNECLDVELEAWKLTQDIYLGMQIISLICVLLLIYRINKYYKSRHVD